MIFIGNLPRLFTSDFHLDTSCDYPKWNLLWPSQAKSPVTFTWNFCVTITTVTFTWKSPVTITNVTITSEISCDFHLEISFDYHRWNLLWLVTITSENLLWLSLGNHLWPSLLCKLASASIQVQITQVQVSKCKYPSVSDETVFRKDSSRCLREKPAPMPCS